MSIHFEWTPEKKMGCFKIVHPSGATYSSFLDHHDLDVSSFRILLGTLDEEVQRKVTPEAYKMAFSDHPLSQDSHPRPPAGERHHNLSVGLSSKGRRRRRSDLR